MTAGLVSHSNLAWAGEQAVLAHLRACKRLRMLAVNLVMESKEAKTSNLVVSTPIPIPIHLETNQIEMVVSETEAPPPPPPSPPFPLQTPIPLPPPPPSPLLLPVDMILEEPVSEPPRGPLILTAVHLSMRRDCMKGGNRMRKPSLELSKLHARPASRARG